jgi:hypothetical protein
MRLPAWHAAQAEVQAHLAWARGEPAAQVARQFAVAAAGFDAAGHVLDAARCRTKSSQAA